MNQGSKANKTGKILESNVETTLKQHGYIAVCEQLPKRQKLNWLLNSTTKGYGTEVYIGPGIYGTDIFVDFYIVGFPIFPSGLIIECKWQAASGSVDEKLPYLNLNIKNCYPAPTIVLIDGGGAKLGGIDWLKKQIKYENQNLVAVHNITSFMCWINSYI